MSILLLFRLERETRKPASPPTFTFGVAFVMYNDCWKLSRFLSELQGMWLWLKVCIQGTDPRET